MCATARVDSAECGTDSRVLCDEGYALFQVAAAEEDVVEHRRHLVDERNVGCLPSLCEQTRRSECSGHAKLYEYSAEHDRD